VRITHSFHPLYGQEFDLVSHGAHWGENRVIYAAADNELRSIAVNFTDLAPPDAFRQVSGGRAAFRTVDLIELWMQLDQYQRQGEPNGA
jgi:hypothetical protein